MQATPKPQRAWNSTHPDLTPSLGRERNDGYLGSDGHRCSLVSSSVVSSRRLARGGSIERSTFAGLLKQTA